MDNQVITRKDFAEAASTAVQAVLNLYGEVDALLRELDTAMQERGFTAWIVNPGTKKVNRKNRILREWRGRIYVRDTGEDEDAGDEVDDAESADDDSEEEDTSRSGPREVAGGSAIAFARVRVYRANQQEHEPDLIFGVLADARVKVEGLDPAEPFRLKRSVLQRILAPLEHTTSAGSKGLPTAPVIVPKGKRVKAKDRLLYFSTPVPFEQVALYDIEARERVREIAGKLHDAWERVSGG